MRISFGLPNGGKIIILDQASFRLLSYRQMSRHQKEAGGLLIGRHLLDNINIVVDQITEPTRWDKRLFNYFFRSRHHNKALNKKWVDSNKTQTLIGLWHTHPEPVPTPSAVDFEDWTKNLQYGEYVGDSLFFMIIGTESIRLWKGSQNDQFEKLKNNPSQQRRCDA